MVLLLSVLSLVLDAQQPVPTSRTLAIDRGAQDPAISPDGTQLALGILGKIWLLPIEGGRARQQTSGPSWDSHPAWSPDGQFLAYALQRPRRTELVLLNLATGGSRTLYAMPNAIGHIAFHPTKPEVFFLRDDNQFESHLWSVGLSVVAERVEAPTDDGKARQLTFGRGNAERSFAISPDGKDVVLDHGGRGAFDIYQLSLDTLRSRRITTSAAEEFNVEWSRDGKELIYLERIEGRESIVRRALADSAGRRVFSSLYDGKQLAIHPDGLTAILVAARRLHRLDLASGRLTPVPFEARFVLPALGPADLTIINARLFDATGRGVMEGANVEIQSGRISRIRVGPLPGGSAAAPGRVLDAKGRMLLPGLMDNHYHFWHHWTFAGADLLASGITSIRDPGAEISESLNFRDAFATGILEGPDLYTLGPLIDGSFGVHPMVEVLLTRPEAAAALVRALKALGVDGIKVYQTLKPDVLRAVVMESRALGLPVSGDIGSLTLWDQAVAAGITGLNHAANYRETALPPELRSYREGEPFDLTRARRGIPAELQYDPDRPSVDSVLREMATRHVSLDPTLAIYWRSEKSLRESGLEQMEKSRLAYSFTQRLVRKAFDAGVTLLAGTDNQAELFSELELYEQAGIPRSAILEAATINGARWLGKQDDVGTIEVGKRANLILVDGDPLKQMKDLRNISVVLKDGRVVFRR